MHPRQLTRAWVTNNPPFSDTGLHPIRIIQVSGKLSQLSTNFKVVPGKIGFIVEGEKGEGEREREVPLPMTF